MFLLAVIAHPAVDGGNFCSRINARLPWIGSRRQNRRHHHADSISPRQVRHRHQIVFDGGGCCRAGIAGNIVCPRQNHNHLRLQRDHIRPETHQHLRRGLAADAAVHIWLAGEEYSGRMSPRVCDGIAHEHHSLLIWEPERPIAHSPRCISPDRRSRSAIARHAFVDTRFQAVSPARPGWQFEAPWQASEWFAQRRREPAGSSYREVSCSHPFDVAYSSVCVRRNQFQSENADFGARNTSINSNPAPITMQESATLKSG